MSPVNIKRTTTNKGRFYEWRAEDGKFWSVTTIVNGGLPKPVLVNWAKKFTAEYACDNYRTLGALLEPDTHGRVDREGAVDWLKNASFRDRDRKGALGTLIHDAAEAYVLGKPWPEWSDDMKPRMDQFLRFLEEWKPVYEDGMVEAPVYNRAERYAGTLDGICILGGRKVLIDYKTGKGVYPEVALQLAAYRHAEFIGAPDGSEIPLPDVDATVVLHVPDVGEYQLIEVDSGPEVFQAFKYVREVFRFMEETSKRVLLGPFPSTLESVPTARLSDPPPIEQLGISTVAPAMVTLDMDDIDGNPITGAVGQEEKRRCLATEAGDQCRLDDGHAGSHAWPLVEQFGISTVARGQSGLPGGAMGEAMRHSLAQAADDANITADVETGEVIPDQLGISTVARGQTDLPETY